MKATVSHRGLKGTMEIRIGKTLHIVKRYDGDRAYVSDTPAGSNFGYIEDPGEMFDVFKVLSVDGDYVTVESVERDVTGIYGNTGRSVTVTHEHFQGTPGAILRRYRNRDKVQPHGMMGVENIHGEYQGFLPDTIPYEYFIVSQKRGNFIEVFETTLAPQDQMKSPIVTGDVVTAAMMNAGIREPLTIGEIRMVGAIYTAAVVRTKTVAAGEGVATGVQVSEVVHTKTNFHALTDEMARAVALAEALSKKGSDLDLADPTQPVEVKLQKF